jgi:REP element-mobilizing transposase RayT
MAEKRRKQIRLKQFDYRTPGAYFVTTCIANREQLLGEIQEGQFTPNELGNAVESTICGLPSRFCGCLIDTYIVMPNHVHIVVMLGAIPEAEGRIPQQGRSRPAPTENHGDAEVQGRQGLVGAGLDLPSPQPRSTTSREALPSLSEVMRAFKTISATKANKILGRTGAPFWQRNYYEHVIRNDAALDRIRTYIANNPANWEQDEENPNRILSPR